jgi:hypothetical protein
MGNEMLPSVEGSDFTALFHRISSESNTFSMLDITSMVSMPTVQCKPRINDH